MARRRSTTTRLVIRAGASLLPESRRMILPSTLVPRRPRVPRFVCQIFEIIVGE